MDSIWFNRGINIYNRTLFHEGEELNRKDASQDELTTHGVPSGQSVQIHFSKEYKCIFTSEIRIPYLLPFRECLEKTFPELFFFSSRFIRFSDINFFRATSEMPGIFDLTFLIINVLKSAYTNTCIDVKVVVETIIIILMVYSSMERPATIYVSIGC